jgi:hypothetical protein
MGQCQRKCRRKTARCGHIKKIEKRSREGESDSDLDRLKEQGYSGSYASVLRLARQVDPKPVETYTRKESEPGEEAEIDFGYVGKMLNAEGNLRKAWAFVMVLAWSRYAYVEFVFDQKVEPAALPPQCWIFRGYRSGWSLTI